MKLLTPSNLRCEHLVNPLGIDAARPRLSWLPPFDPAAYQVVVTDDRGRKLWDTGKVKSAESLQIEYDGKPLAAAQRCTWKARVWDKSGRASARSEPAFWMMGLLQPADWKAGWIGAPVGAEWKEFESPPSPMLRKAFTLPGKVDRAILRASALGLYELRLNGRRVGDQVLAPEWTDYRVKAQYQTCDVTGLLREGDNVLGAILSPGWYAGQLGLGTHARGFARGHYGRHLRLLAQLDVELAKGQRLTIGSDGTWKYTTDGPIRGSDLLAGELYDARREMPGWDAPGFDDSAWQPVEVSNGTRLVAQPNEPIRVTRELRPVAVTEPKSGVFIFDLGQNMVGWVRATIRGAAGVDVRFRHAEVLNPDGTLYRDNLRLDHARNNQCGAQQEDHYICNGSGDEVFEPRFTYHGFRYVEVTGVTKPPEIIGRVLHSAAADTGRFECSEPLLNKIFAAIQWTLRGNLHSVPTDCPQRDERLGWMGDMQVFSQTAIFLMDMAAFLTKWLRDVRDNQASDGRFPDFAPQPFGPDTCFSGNPGWADAGVIVPWRAYVNYGDIRLLAESYPAAERWIGFVHRHNPDLLWRNRLGTSLTYGDWLNSDTFEKLANIPHGKGACPNDVYATAFFAYSTELVGKMAAVLGRKTQAANYRKLAAAIRTAFVKEFVTYDAKIKGDTQAGYALALHFDLLPVALRKRAAQRLVAGLKPFHGHLSTGIQSTVRAMLELTRWGHADIAYDLITKTTIPSWGYMVEHGGTTIWERWDGWVEGRGFQNPAMNSFNHYAIGAVGEWMWRVIVGLNPDETQPGWKHFHVRPIPGRGLTWVRGEYRSVRGPICSEWRTENGRFVLNVTVPPNTTATVQLPGKGSKAVRVGPGAHQFERKLED
jgi:alpha-L-rhamnosidase